MPNPSLTELEQLHLVEARPSPTLHLSAVERQALEQHFDAKITTEPGNAFRVQPGSVVGSIQVEGRTFVVQPKLTIDRVLFMTAYTADPHRWHDQWTTIANARTLTDGVAALFVTAYERTLASGLLRAYRAVERNEPTIRGRIRWQHQARRPGPLPVAIRYQIHDDDILENHILRAATLQLRRQRITDPAIRSGLARIWHQLRDLTPAAPVTPELIDRLTWTRHNAHYRPLVRLAQTILTGTMPDLSSGAVPVIGFTLRLFDVFEQFVRSALRESLGASSTEFPDDPRAHELFLDARRRVRLKPDLGLRDGPAWVFIGDVKYKTDKGKGHNPDLYQLLAYASASQLDEAWLIYADGPPGGRTHLVPPTGIRLAVHHLNLDQPPAAVLRDLSSLASRVRTKE